MNIGSRHSFPAFLLLVALGLLFGQIYHIRADASKNGQGLSWADAFKGVPKALQRGAVYYVADGVAHFTGTLQFKTDRWILDGKVGDRDSGHGFKVTTSQCFSPSKPLRRRHGILAGLLVLHGGFLPYGCYLLLPARRQPDHDDVEPPHRFGDLHNFFEKRHSKSGIHGEAISMNDCGLGANNVLSYNVFKDVLGNAFYQSGARYYTSSGAVCNTAEDANSQMYVVNNTFSGSGGDHGEPHGNTREPAFAGYQRQDYRLSGPTDP